MNICISSVCNTRRSRTYTRITRLTYIIQITVHYYYNYCYYYHYYNYYHHHITIIFITFYENLRTRVHCANNMYSRLYNIIYARINTADQSSAKTAVPPNPRYICNNNNKCNICTEYYFKPSCRGNFPSKHAHVSARHAASAPREFDEIDSFVRLFRVSYMLLKILPVAKDDVPDFPNP